MGRYDPDIRRQRNEQLTQTRRRTAMQRSGERLIAATCALASDFVLVFVPVSAAVERERRRRLRRWGAPGTDGIIADDLHTERWSGPKDRTQSAVRGRTSKDLARRRQRGPRTG